MLKLFLFLVFISSISASSLNFQELLNYSLLNNIQLKSSKLDINLAYENKQEQEKLSYGNLDYSFTAQNTNHAAYVLNAKLGSKQMSPSDFLHINNPKPRTNYENKLSYTLPIFTGFKIKNAKRISQLHLLANKFKHTLNEKLFSLELLIAYESVILANANINTIKESKISTFSYLHYAKELYKEGLGTKIDLELAKVNYLNIESYELEANNNLTLAIEYLKFLSNNYTITTVKKSFFSLEKNESLKYIQDLALKQREDLKVFDLNIKKQKINTKIKKSFYYPNISLFGQYGHNSQNIDLFTKEKDFYILSLNLNYNLFNAKNKSELEKSKINLLKINLQKEDHKNLIKFQVKKDYLNLQTKIKIFKQKKLKKDLSKNILFKSHHLYKNKLISMSELLKQETKNQENNYQYIFAKFEVIIAQARLRIRSGKSLKEKNNE